MIMVTNDDGIEGPGLQSLVQLLASTNRYQVCVCAPDTYVKFRSSLVLVTTCLYDCVTVLAIYAVAYNNLCRVITYI